ncbi:hypothetical protein IOD14_34575 [Streptomyces sp. A2-16]|uniref:hypothetical protein n=1 Tax=Streptomyces sp. A2-16 TaxID=2781734 RepID=UPI001BAFAA1F|nr:hypothetical protein [Streptomyces sp. A2-16]QUC61504.1 hypothetical protein IOD14_34575 [Streptomyces sp. A2-16]
MRNATRFALNHRWDAPDVNDIRKAVSQMPSQDEKRHRLENDLRQHTHRVECIQDELRNLNNELRIHNILLSLGRNEKLLALLDRLRDDEGLMREARKGGRSFFEERGVELPSEIQTVTSAPTNQGTKFRGIFLDDAGREFEVAWDTHNGYGGMHPELREARKKPLNLSLSYEKVRTQLSTDFTLIGSGYSPGGQVAIGIIKEPGKSVETTSLGNVTAHPSATNPNIGVFRYFYRAWYLPPPDPQTRSPLFAARDVTHDQGTVTAVPSSLWYPLL